MKFLLLLISSLLSAQITFEQIDSKPSSRAKNFLIWQYLQQDITPNQADDAFYEIENVNAKMFLTYAKKSDSPEVKYVARCMTLKVEDLLKTKDNNCLQISISPFKATYFTPEQRKKLIDRVFVQDTKDYLTVMSSQLDEKTLLSYTASQVLTVMNEAGKKFRQENFNRIYTKEFMNYLATSWKISRLIESVVTDNSLNKLQESLMFIDGKNLNANSNFLLALNYLNHGNKEKALSYLDTAHKKANNEMDKDKTLFWQYLITNDKKYLQSISLGSDINIYSLYASEVLHIDVKNYFTEAQTVLGDESGTENIKDPFVWIDVREIIRKTPKKNLFEIADQYSTKRLLPLKAFALERAYGYKNQGYIMPYTKYTSTLPKDDQAFMYALMRQESHFIPSAISSSYALGLMQLMPFLVDNLKTKMSQKITCYSDMFEPKYNIPYAVKHLEWLNKQLSHPLLKAYAYNAGVGFTKRYIESDKFTDKEYEPFLSMDMMQNSECREYGKKVLANYVMYKKIMGEEVSIVHLFDILKVGKRSDHFPKQVR